MNIVLFSLCRSSHRVRELIVGARCGVSLATAFVALTMVAHTDAQTPPESHAEAHPAHARVNTAASEPPSLAYKSVFERYRSFRDETVGSWRDANDTVTRVGGWREYLKEAQRPEPANNAPQGGAPQNTPPAPAVRPNPHAGHEERK